MREPAWFICALITGSKCISCSLLNLSTAEVSSLVFKFENDEPIELDEQFLRKSNDNKAYFPMYGAPTFDGYAPVRSIYRGLQRASDLALYTSAD